MAGDVTYLAPPATLYGRVRRVMHDFALCGFTEIEITQDEDAVVVQVPPWTDAAPSFLRDQAAGLLARRGLHAHLRDTLSIVVMEGCR